MKRLVFGTSYITDIERRELVRLWVRMMTKIAPDCDLLVVDSASPIDVIDEKWQWPYKSITVKSLGDNIGHMSLTGRDGWGRAFCAGLQHAIDNEYDQVALIDTDILFAKPIGPIFDKMAKAGVKCAAPMDNSYWFVESAIMFFDVEWLKEIGFIQKYDWENPPPLSAETNPERRVELAAGDDLFILPLRGLRNDFGKLTPAELDRAHFPYGLDYLTHLGNFSLAWKFLEFNGLGDV